MTDEQDTTEEPETTPEAAVEAPEQAVAAEQAEAPEQAEPDAGGADADAPVEQVEPAEQAGVEAGAAAAAAAVAEPAEQLSPKERRRKARSTHSGEARPQRSPDERHSERVALRKAKAVRRRARRLQEREKLAAARAARGGEAVQSAPTAPLHPPAGEPVRKVRQGIVVSDKADKTITVRIDIARRHRRYEKIVRSSNTLHAHDENNDAHEGDTVRVIESRPLSRTKRWRLIDVLERAR